MSLTTTQDLLDLPTDEFHALVEEVLRYKPDLEALHAGEPEEMRLSELAGAMRTPVLIERYYYALVSISKRVESTLGSRKAQLHRDRPKIIEEKGEAGLREAEQVYSSFRSSTLRFKGGLDQELVHAKHLLQQYRAIDRTSQLEGAIRRHRSDMEALNEDPSPYDRELWSALDG